MLASGLRFSVGRPRPRHRVTAVRPEAGDHGLRLRDNGPRRERLGSPKAEAPVTSYGPQRVAAQP